MKVIYSYLLVILLFFIPVSCKKGESVSSDFDKISFSRNNISDKVNISEISNEVQYIILKNDQIIGNITKIEQQDNYIYISDHECLYKYSLEGDFISLLNKLGGGPDEYLGISDFAIEGDNILILSRNNKKIYRYSWNGDLLNSVYLEYWVSNFKLLANNKLLLYIGNEIGGDNEYRIKLYNLDTESVENEYLEIDSYKARYLHVNSLNHFSESSSSKGVFYFEMFNDTIYYLDEKGIKPAYYLEYFRNIPKSMFEKNYSNIMEFFQAILPNGYSYGTEIFLQSPTSSISTFYSEGECIMGVHPFKGVTTPLLFRNIVEDINFYDYPINLTELPIFIQSDNSLAIVVESMDLLDYLPPNNNPLREQLSPDGNPVILLVKLK